MKLLRTSSFNSINDIVGIVKEVSGATRRSSRRTSANTRSKSSPRNSMRSSTRGSTASLSTTSLKLVGSPAELSLDDFEQFLSQTLSAVVDSETSSELSNSLKEDDLRDTFQAMEQGLQSLLESHSSLPAAIMGETYSYLGLVYLEQQRYTSAINALTKGLWFKSRTSEEPFAIAQANHRLGIAFGRNKEYEQAMAMMDKALDAYDTSSEYYVMAKEDRHSFQEAHLLALLVKTRPQAIHRSVEGKSTNKTTTTVTRRPVGPPLQRTSTSPVTPKEIRRANRRRGSRRNLYSSQSARSLGDLSTIPDGETDDNATDSRRNAEWPTTTRTTPIRRKSDPNVLLTGLTA